MSLSREKERLGKIGRNVWQHGDYLNNKCFKLLLLTWLSAFKTEHLTIFRDKFSFASVWPCMLKIVSVFFSFCFLTLGLELLLGCCGMWTLPWNVLIQLPVDSCLISTQGLSDIHTWWEHEIMSLGRDGNFSKHLAENNSSKWVWNKTIIGTMLYRKNWQYLVDNWPQ